MSALSVYLEGSVLNHLFRSATFQKPTTLAFCLLIAPASSTDTGDLAGKEVVNANGYARASLIPSDDNWTPPDSNGVIRNKVLINFPIATGNWGSIVGVAVTDSITYGEGNLLFQGLMSPAQSVYAGMTFTFNVADVAVSVR